jgi:CubicO group peptidase (beta-lactamase class C family)
MKIKRTGHISLLLVALSICAAPLLGQHIKKMDDQTWNAINDVVANEYAQHNLKGISVAVVYGGNIAYANGMGDKNANGDPFTINTKSLLASVSKTITGILAMRLVENGDIALNDPISAYLPDYDGSGITIRHLLNHQSGIAHYSDCPEGYDGTFVANDSYDVVLECSMCMSPPGSSTLYTTYGNTLLGVIISHVGFEIYGMGYVGLYNTWLKNPGILGTLEPAFDDSDPGLAEGSLEETGWEDIGWKLPAGGFISNILDLADYTRGVLNNTFIAQATLDQMKVLQVPTGTPNFDCGEDGADNFGLGFQVSGNNPAADNFFLSHTGLNSHGYSSYMAIYTNRNAAVVMMTNTDEAVGALIEIRDGIEDLILCPATREFTNTISWTEPRIFESGQITGRSAVTSDYDDTYIFDSTEWVKLLPGFHAPAGKSFRALVTDGCGGVIVTD